MVKTSASILLAAMLLPAQDSHSSLVSSVPVIRAQGRATVKVKPDQVQIDIGVVTQARTAEAAGAENAKASQSVIAAVKKIAGPDADIQTINYSVTPQYRYPKEGGTPSIAGYSAQNVVRVKTPRLDRVGELIDAGTAQGANRIQGIEFSVKDERALRTQALREAARDARANADAIASGLGLKIVRVLQVEDSGAPPPPRPMMRAEMMMAKAADSAAPTPVEAGTIEVEDRVMITVQVAPQ